MRTCTARFERFVEKRVGGRNYQLLFVEGFLVYANAIRPCKTALSHGIKFAHNARLEHVKRKCMPVQVPVGLHQPNPV